MTDPRPPAAPAPENESPSLPGPARRSRSALAMLGGASAWLLSLVVVLVGFVATPILLDLLGRDRLGAVRAAEQWFGYLVLLHFGLSNALNVYLLGASSRGDRASVAAITAAGMRLHARQSMFLLPVALGLAWAMPILVPVEPALVTDLRIGSAITAIAVLALIPVGLLRNVLECSQLGYRVNGALMAQSLAVTAVGILLAWAGFGLLGQFAAVIAGLTVLHALLVVFSRDCVPSLWRTRPENIARGPLWKLRWPLGLAVAANQVSVLTDGIVIAAVLGPGAVIVFGVTQRLVSFVGGFVSSLSGVTWAALAELRAQEPGAFAARMLELVRVTVGVGLVLIFTAAGYNHHFVRLWVGNDNYGGDLLTALTAVQLLLFGFLLLFVWVLDTQGHTRDRVAVSAAGSVLKLGLSIVLARQLGLPGVTLATVVAFVATDAWFAPYVFSKRYGVSAASIAAAAARGLVFGAPWAAGVWMFAHRKPVTGWISLILELGLSSVAAVVYSWIFILTRDDRMIWRGRTARVWRRVAQAAA